MGQVYANCSRLKRLKCGPSEDKSLEEVFSAFSSRVRKENNGEKGTMAWGRSLGCLFQEFKESCFHVLRYIQCVF